MLGPDPKPCGERSGRGQCVTPSRGRACTHTCSRTGARDCAKRIKAGHRDPLPEAPVSVLFRDLRDGQSPARRAKILAGSLAPCCWETAVRLGAIAPRRGAWGAIGAVDAGRCARRETETGERRAALGRETAGRKAERRAPPSSPTRGGTADQAKVAGGQGFGRGRQAPPGRGRTCGGGERRGESQAWAGRRRSPRSPTSSRRCSRGARRPWTAPALSTHEQAPQSSIGRSSLSSL